MTPKIGDRVYVKDYGFGEVINYEQSYGLFNVKLENYIYGINSEESGNYHGFIKESLVPKEIWDSPLFQALLED